MTGIDITLFLIICGLLLSVSLRRARQSEAFLVADRQVGFLPLTATLVMTEFNTATLLAFAAVGYVVGPRAIGLSAVFLIGLAWYTLSVARHWKRYNGLSVAQWFTQRYGAALGRTASVMLIVAMIGFSAIYVKSLTLLLLPVLGDPSPWLLSGILCLSIGGITVLGGLATVVRLDVFSFLLTIVLLPFLLFQGWRRAGGIITGTPEQLDYWLQWSHPQLPWWFVISLVMLTCLTYIASPWYGQKIFAAADEKTAVGSVGAASVLVFLMYGSVQLSAGFLRASHPPLDDPQMAVPTMFRLWLPTGIRGTGFAVLFAAGTTTLAGVWSAMVAMIVSDFKRSWTAQLSAQRCLTGVVVLLSWLGSNLFIDDILNRMILANIPIAALSFALLAGFHWTSASCVGAWLSVIVGISWGVFCFVYWGDAGGYTWPWAIYGTALIFGTGYVGSQVFPDVPTTSTHGLDSTATEKHVRPALDSRPPTQTSC